MSRPQTPNPNAERQTKNPKPFRMYHLLRYTTYNLWANDKILSLIKSRMTNELLDKEINSSFPSLRKTIYQIWDAEYHWLRRLNGESLLDWPSKNFNGEFSLAIEKILSIDKDFILYTENLSEEKASSPFTYKNIEGKTFTNPVWESVMHCMNHSTYHRGQAVTMLRQLGVTEIPSTDFISFCRI